MDKNRLDALLDDTIDHRFKGLSAATYGRTLRSVSGDRQSLFAGAFSPPVMVLRQRALENDIEAMARYCIDRGVLLAPHGKTTLAPQLFARQIERGAWGVSVATPSQATICRAFGVRRVLLANELVDTAAIAWIVDELRSDDQFEFLCYVDSVEGVARLSAAAGSGNGRGIDVLIELGFDGGRTGCRTTEQAVEVATAAAAAPGISVVGVAGYEGGIGHQISAEVLESVRVFLQRIRDTASELVARELVTFHADGIILTAGGSTFFDDVVTVLSPALADGTPVRCVVRAGSYVTHDTHLYERRSPFTRPGADPRWHLLAAIEVWSQVLSTPEPGLALVGMGKRDAAFDEGMPIPQQLFRSADTGLTDASAFTISNLNDQHGYLKYSPDADVRVGDWLGCGINHPCTQFDKWHVIPVVDDDYCVVDFVRTFF